MNILFITLGRTIMIDKHGIYSDLMRKFHYEGHTLFIVHPLERKEKRPTSLINDNNIYYLGVRTLNLQKTNILEKGLGTLLVESQFSHAIHKYFKSVSFDLILYTTPPITFPNLICHLKKVNPNAISYLMLKDIFPQNAVDLGMFRQNGLIYRYFRAKERKLYKHSDFIGCMSPANVDFIIRNNPFIDCRKVEVCPNSLEIVNETSVKNNREETLRRYNLPTDCPIVLYGGNLGRPQGIDFLIKAIDNNSNRHDCHFLIVGDGTEYGRIDAWIKDTKPSNVTLMNRLSKEDYDELARYCDIGLICLDHRFTIPNFPSRLLAYLENHMPVIVSTDPNCDMGPIAHKNGFGFWCESNDVDAFTDCLNRMLSSDIKAMGEVGYQYLCNHYLVDNTFEVIMNHLS